MEAWPGILQAVATSIASGDPHIALAMDGIQPSMNNRPLDERSVRQDHCVFFFIIFGLVYEALSNGTVDSTISTRQPAIIAALQILKYLVKPQFSGRALQDPATCDEFTNLCYRMAMTETIDIQVHLIEVLVTLAMNQDFDHRFV